MIEEQAQIIEIKGEKLILQAQTQSACGSCAISKGCGTSVLAKVLARKFTRFEAKNNLEGAVNVQVGDTVVVGISEDALLSGSMMVYIVPIIGMLIAALMADASLSVSMQARDLSVAASAFAGLVFSAFIVKTYVQRQSRRQKFTPVVLRKIIGHAKL